MRDDISSALKKAMQDRNKCETNTLRLIMAAIKDRDISRRVGGDGRISDEEILEVLSKMVRQREESAAIYEAAGRLELAETERQEIEIIQRFLPQQLDNAATVAACQKAIQSCGAGGLRDMGKVMGELKDQYPGQMDFGKASGIVKDLLG
ncbi:MAG: GatB/YqeY domain-containing protein [Rhizobiales bacterium]|nr:GatB/YqeY domain-containing protein [Hyphomicrobiales bacterium]